MRFGRVVLCSFVCSAVCDMGTSCGELSIWVKRMHTWGIEPRSQAWEACMMPLHYVCGYLLHVCVPLIDCAMCSGMSCCGVRCTGLYRLCMCVCMRACWSLPKTKCRDPGSNWGPSDLRSDALPTELSRLDQMVTLVLVPRMAPDHAQPCSIWCVC